MSGTRAPAPSPGEVTRLIEAWRSGDEAARDRLIPVVYEELRRRAAGHLRRERGGHTLRPTDLVHETYLRLVAQDPAWQNREQLFAVASRQSPTCSTSTPRSTSWPPSTSGRRPWWSCAS